LTEERFNWDESLILFCDPTIEGAKQQAGRLLNREAKPTAIFGYNDLSAIGAMITVIERGLRIPDELSVMGFDTHHFAVL
jgi:DNA-binding LacI/PurR family transcriptional regulator